MRNGEEQGDPPANVASAEISVPLELGFVLLCLLLVCLFVLNSAVDDALVADYNLLMLFCDANDLMMKECFVLVCRALHSADVKF